jgi:stress response protein YsnF
MTQTIAARFETEAEAEQALAMISADVALLDSAVLTAGRAAAFTLDGFNLDREERSTCEAGLERGGFLLIAQAPGEGAAAAALQLLESKAGQLEPLLPTSAAAPTAQPNRSAAPPPSAAAATAAPAAPAGSAAESASPSATTAEERIPLLEEELRIGKREVLRGGARVRTFTSEAPVQEQVELWAEHTEVSRREVGRRLSEDEVREGGLLQERVVEITEMREEAVVSKEAFVREELVVTKNVERRVETINETLRRTEVETHDLGPEARGALGGFQSAGQAPAGERRQP